jgi:large subunit ribosomal protein L22
MTATKTNERPGTRAQVRYARVSASKARVVLDLIRNQPVATALEILDGSERDVADTIRKVLESAVANAEHNDELDPDELAVVACYADEGPTLKRFRPRARGRAARIRKRTCHITVIVARMDDEQLERLAAKAAAGGRAGSAQAAAAARRERVARSRAAKAERAAEEHDHDHDHDHDHVDEVAEAEVAEVEVDEAGTDEVDVAEVEVDEADVGETAEAGDDDDAGDDVADADGKDDA